MAPSPRRALVIQPAFLGDVVLATPLVESLAAGGYRVDMLVRRGAESLLEGHPHLADVLVWDKRGRLGKYRDWLRLRGRIRAARYAVVVNPHRYASSGAWVAQSGAPDRRGFRQNPLSRAYTLGVEHRFGDGTHEVDRNLGLLAGLDVPLHRRPRLYPSPRDTERAAPPTGAYATLSPASVWFTKRYPAERWVALAKALPTGLHLELLGAPGDRDLCERIAREAGRPARVRAGELTLLQSAALMRGARMNYVNDSAPLHLASAVDAPVTAFFLNTTPAFGFGPLSTRAHVREVVEPLACKPCGMTGKRACPQGHFRCSHIAPTP